MFGIDPATGKRVEGLEAQLDKALRNIRGLLDQAGTTPDSIAHLTVMLQDYADAPRVSAALRELFPDPENAPALKFITYRMPAPWRGPCPHPPPPSMTPASSALPSALPL